MVVQKEILNKGSVSFLRGTHDGHLPTLNALARPSARLRQTEGGGLAACNQQQQRKNARENRTILRLPCETQGTRGVTAQQAAVRHSVTLAASTMAIASAAEACSVMSITAEGDMPPHQTRYIMVHSSAQPHLDLSAAAATHVLNDASSPAAQLHRTLMISLCHSS